MIVRPIDLLSYFRVSRPAEGGSVTATCAWPCVWGLPQLRPGAPASVIAGLDQAGLVGEDDGLGPVAEA